MVFVDDASTDDTEKLIKTDFKAMIDEGKLIYIRNETNMERSFSRNRGVEASGGDFVAFLDSDDIWVPDHIEKAVERILELDCDILYTFPAYTDRDHTIDIDRVIKEKEEKYIEAFTGVKVDELITRNMISYPTGILIKKEIYLESGGFRSDVVVAEDWELVSRLLFKHGAKIEVSFRPTYLIRLHSGNTFGSSKFWEDSFDIIRNGEMIDRVLDCDFIDSKRKKFLVANMLLTVSKIAFARAMLIVGWKCVVRAFLLHPGMIFFHRRGILFFALKRGFIPKTLAISLKRKKDMLRDFIADIKKFRSSGAVVK